MEKQRKQQQQLQSRSAKIDEDDDIPFQPVSMNQNPFKSNNNLQQPASPEQQFSLFQQKQQPQQYQTQQPTQPQQFQQQQQQQQYQTQAPSLLDFDNPAQQYNLPPPKPAQQQFYSPPTNTPPQPEPKPQVTEPPAAATSNAISETDLRLATDLCAITKTQYDDAIDFA